MYDKYIVDLIGAKLSIITDCTAVNKCEDYRSFEIVIIKDFNLHVICKKLIENKKPHFDNLICELSVSALKMKLNEFQILFLIDCLRNFMKIIKCFSKKKKLINY